MDDQGYTTERGEHMKYVGIRSKEAKTPGPIGNRNVDFNRLPNIDQQMIVIHLMGWIWIGPYQCDVPLEALSLFGQVFIRRHYGAN